MPRMIYAAVLALVFAGSVVVRRPLVGIIIGALYRAPSEWINDRRVRRAFGRGDARVGRPVRVPRRSSTSC